MSGKGQEEEEGGHRGAVGMTHTPLREIFQCESTTGESRSRLRWDISFCLVGGHPVVTSSLHLLPPSEPSPQLFSLLTLLSSRANHTTREERAQVREGVGMRGSWTGREQGGRFRSTRAGSRDSPAEGCYSVNSDGAVTSDLVLTKLT